MNTISPEKLEKLDVLYTNGQFAGIAPGEFKYLQESDIDNLIFEAGQNLAGTYQIPDKSTRESVDKLLDSGVLPFTPEDARYLSLMGANSLIWLVYSSNRHRTYVLTKPQQKRIRHLINKGFLPHMSDREIVMLSKEKANRLIEEGENNALYEEEF